MRIAIVTPGFVVDRDEPGLPGVVDLIERIAAVHECAVVALRYPAARSPYVVAGARVHALGYGSAAGAFARSRILAGGVRAVLGLHRRRPFDLIHAMFADEAGAVATVAARLLRRPSIVSVLGGELTRLPEIGYGAALGRGGRWTVSVALRLADSVTTGSSLARAEVVGSRIEAPVVVLPLGVDLSTFRPAARRSHGPLLFVGSLEPVKDPIAALRAFAAIAATRPALRLAVAGEGSLRAEAERFVNQAVLAGRVHFHGQVPRTEMPALYRASSALVVTSRHEGQSLAAVEAAASGLPLIGTRVGALPDLGTGAVTVPVGDQAALVEVLAKVVDDDALAARMGRAAREAAAAHFDIERTAAAVLDRYAALASGRVPAANA